MRKQISEPEGRVLSVRFAIDWLLSYQYLMSSMTDKVADEIDLSPLRDTR